ncbi:MAG: GNAT family N-acetyltransferase [Saprospiraceae bacterium]
MTKIIQANSDHLNVLAELFDAYRIFYGKPSDIAGARHFLAERLEYEESIVYLAQADNGVYVGFTQLYPVFSSTRMQRMWILNDLYVLPDYRGKGISKLLIDRAKELARATNASGILLETAKNNEIGNKLYPSVGFELNKDFNFYFWTNA